MGGRRVDLKTKTAIIKTGADVEVEYPSDVFKARTTALMDTPLHTKKRTDFVEKPNKVRDCRACPSRGFAGDTTLDACHVL